MLALGSVWVFSVDAWCHGAKDKVREKLPELLSRQPASAGKLTFCELACGNLAGIHENSTVPTLPHFPGWWLVGQLSKTKDIVMLACVIYKCIVPLSFWVSGGGAKYYMQRQRKGNELLGVRKRRQGCRNFPERSSENWAYFANQFYVCCRD